MREEAPRERTLYKGSKAKVEEVAKESLVTSHRKQARRRGGRRQRGTRLPEGDEGKEKGSSRRRRREKEREMCHIQMVPTCQVVHLNISVQLSLHVYKIAPQNQGRVLSFAKLKGWGIRSNCENFNLGHQINI